LRAKDADAKEGLACEQLDPGGSWRSCPSEPIRLCRLVPGVHDLQQFVSLVDHSTAIITNHHEDYSFGHLPPMATLPDELLRHPWNLIIVELILSSPILFTAGIHFPRVFLHNQGYPKVCPDSLNLSNTGNFLARISSLTSCYLFSRTRGLIAIF
jgi:hypothetical protein